MVKTIDRKIKIHKTLMLSGLSKKCKMPSKVGGALHLYTSDIYTATRVQQQYFEYTMYTLITVTVSFLHSSFRILYSQYVVKREKKKQQFG